MKPRYYLPPRSTYKQVCLVSPAVTLVFYRPNSCKREVARHEPAPINALVPGPYTNGTKYIVTLIQSSGFICLSCYIVNDHDLSIYLLKSV